MQNAISLLMTAN